MPDDNESPAEDDAADEQAGPTPDADDRGDDTDGDDGDVGDDEEADGDAGRPGPLTRADLHDGRRPDRLGPLVLGGLALLMVGFIVGRVTAEEQPDEPPTTTAAPFLFPTGDQDRAGYWGFGGVTPVLSDTFDRADDPAALGQTDTGERWTVAGGGRWGIEDDRAVADPGATTSFAVVDGGPAERLTEATLMTVEPGAGITFRHRDRGNHWSLTVMPARGVWELNRVVDGETTLVAEVAGPVAAGTTVTVAQRGPELQVLLDGQEATRVSDPALRDQARSGLVAPAGGEGLARWDRFYVGAMPGAEG